MNWSDTELFAAADAPSDLKVCGRSDKLDCNRLRYSLKISLVLDYQRYFDRISL